MANRRRASVGIHLVVAFGACLVGLGALMALTTASSFERERERAATVLRTAAQEDVRWADETVPEAVEVLGSVGTQDGIRTFDTRECGAVLSGLASLTTQGHLQLFRPDGSPVCSLRAPDLPDREIVKGDWFDEVRATAEPVNGGTGIDPLSGRPAITIALPVEGTNGEVGVLAAVLFTDLPLELPTGAPPEMVVIELDPTRSLVLATSEGAPVRAGAVGRSWLTRPLGEGVHTVVDSDGVTRLYQELTAPEIDWHILVGLPRSVALRAAEQELRRNLWLGGAILLVVGGLGFVLHRRLARPVRRLRRAIEAAGSDDSARAPVDGPAEIADVAEAFNDTIARRRELEVELAHQALHDPLTGLPNRTLVGDRLAQALVRRTRTSGGTVVVAFMDLDRFKLVNDSKGHPAGDALLVALARRLEGAMRSADTVARFGGDEFVMVSEGIRGEAEVTAIASRLTSVLDDPFTVGGEDLFISGSIGLAVAGDGDTADDLIRNADAAMYVAKERERGGFAVYQDPLHKGVVTRLNTERDLHRALDEGEFLLHYQPKCSLATAEVVGVEALIRWAHPERGLVSPADFIPVCEDTGMIVPIGEWVLFEAGRQIRRWRDRHGLSVAVSVNLSARQLVRPDLTGLVARMLAETGADPADLCLEITEGTLLQDMNAAVAHLAELRSLGVRISIDDFGTGYSSLAYLRTLPLDELKIDRSFVTSVADDPSAAAIVESVVTLGHALGLLVVAEGVETAAQLTTLRELGCDLAQGYYLSRPAPAGDILPVLQRKPGLWTALDLTIPRD